MELAYIGNVYCINTILEFLVYGVFARQTIPGRTQFGPVEGVLVKTENEDKGKEDDSNELQLSVEADDKFWKLDVSNEGNDNFFFLRRVIRTYINKCSAIAWPLIVRTSKF